MEKIKQCPTIEPTYQQFSHFETFVHDIERKYSKQYGMVKIVPPKEWKSRSKNYKKILDGLKIENPQYQGLYGNSRQGFQCVNAKSNKNFTLKEFKEIAKTRGQEIKKLKQEKQIELKFWQTVENIKRELYCANIEATLMDETSQQWQLEKLKSTFSHAITQKLTGLNTSFLFIGSWRTFFNWHVEDMDLSAINILHQGATKVWYAIHPDDFKKFQQIVKGIFPQLEMQCGHFLRHKSTFINPYIIKQESPSIKISKVYQRQGDIVLVFSQAYHGGFNMGYNIAEAVNYGTISWIDKLVKFKGCNCQVKAGVRPESLTEIVTNLTKSTIYQQIKDLSSFKKLAQKGQKQRMQDQKFEKTPKQQIYQQFFKCKTKKINKGLKHIYVPRFKRYFDHDYQLQQQQQQQPQIQCSDCGQWQTTNQDTCKKYGGKKPFLCSYINKQCPKSKKKSQQKLINQRVTRSKK